MLYSIGYANKQIDEFISILKKHNINSVVDVRTIPNSSQFKDYNKYNIERILKNNGIYYLSFKDEFGARRCETEVYDDILTCLNEKIKVVVFEKVWQLPIFKSGVERILNGLDKEFNICFMCSEKQPQNCHRAIMVSEYFYREHNLEIKHIVDSNVEILHSALDSEILNNFNKMKNKFMRNNIEKIKYANDLFNTAPKDNNLIFWENFFNNYTREKGYYLQNLQIGYKQGEEGND